MTTEQKLALLEELFELEANTLDPEQAFRELDTWDSFKGVELLAFVDEHSGKPLSADKLKAMVTIRDILDYMG